MKPCRLARTASRSVLGVMNEFRYLADVYVKLDGETDPLSLSLRLAMTPCGPLYERHVSPDRELAALVSSGSQAARSRKGRRTAGAPHGPARRGAEDERRVWDAQPVRHRPQPPASAADGPIVNMNIDHRMSPASRMGPL
jgi:hypothetical protein